MTYMKPTSIGIEEKDVVDGKLVCLLKSSKDLEDIIEGQRSEKVKEGVGYNVVPPPAADLYLSPKKDLSWTGLPEFVDDTVTDYSRPSPNVASTSSEDQNKDILLLRRPNGAHMRPPLRSSGPRPHGNSMRPPFRPAGHRPHGPSMNPRRPTMNGARPYKTFFHTPSFKTRPFLKSSAVNNSYRTPWVPTVN
nr:hypothetical protein [Tanacetum cinerariifolium]